MEAASETVVTDSYAPNNEDSEYYKIYGDKMIKYSKELF